MSNDAEGAILIVLAASLAWAIRRSFQLGKAAPGHYITAGRARHPILFWLQVGVYGAGLIPALSVAAIRLAA